MQNLITKLSVLSDHEKKCFFLNLLFEKLNKTFFHLALEIVYMILEKNPGDVFLVNQLENNDNPVIRKVLRTVC